jgi:hypothetical protein
MFVKSAIVQPTLFVQALDKPAAASMIPDAGYVEEW